ncbi:ABC transporter ATP-binding protein [Microtetraspora sp. NBRC 13810]|nr:ABC transporter ATP-binding protein [Microtetraspora sp. NBRC 13810]
MRDCTIDIPSGHVVGLVGPNGAGKTTLLKLAGGQLAPTAGAITVLGGHPTDHPAQLARIGFVAQNTPTYAGMTVADHLRLGARLKPGWDAALARERIGRLGLDPAHRAGKLSGGQRAQLALTLGLAKRPELLILDEPVASLDPLARRELQGLMEAVVEQELSVVLSSHVVADLERTCDYLIVLVDSRVQAAGEVERLLATHHRLSGPRRDPGRLPADQPTARSPRTSAPWTARAKPCGPMTASRWSRPAVRPHPRAPRSCPRPPGPIRSAPPSCIWRTPPGPTRGCPRRRPGSSWSPCGTRRGRVRVSGPPTCPRRSRSSP